MNLREALKGIDGPVVAAASGGRDYTDDAMVDFVMGGIHKLVGVELVIEGGCPVGDGGLDSRVRKWAKKNEVNCITVPAKSKKYGWPQCGPLRNEEMGRMKPDVWVLFPGGKGTDSARRIAAKLGIKTVEVGYED